MELFLLVMLVIVMLSILLKMKEIIRSNMKRNGMYHTIVVLCMNQKY